MRYYLTIFLIFLHSICFATNYYVDSSCGTPGDGTTSICDGEGTDDPWDDNAKVYICPDGVCFSGSAPDIGVYEYEEISNIKTLIGIGGKATTGLSGATTFIG